MKLRMGNREKKVIGGILTILFIAGLHFMVFSKKAQEFDNTLEQWKNAKRNAKNVVGQAKNITDLKKFEETNAQMKKEYEQIIESLRIYLPKYYLDGSEDSVEKRREFTRQYIDKIMSLEEEYEDMDLSFLGEGGWNLPDALPEEIQDRPERLWDVISQLNSIDGILDVIENPSLMEEQMNKYDTLLKEIGVNEDQIDALEEKCGKFVPFINKYAHYKLIIEQKPETVNLSDEEIMDLLRVEFPDNSLYGLNRQLFALIDIIQKAQQNEVQDITQAFLYENEPFKKPPEEREEGEGEEDAGAAQPREFMDPMMMGPAAGGRGGPEGAMGPMGMRFGGGAMPQQQQEEPQVDKNILGQSAPVMLQFKASNYNISNFLYEITHMPRSYELDSLIINNEKEEDNVVNVFAMVNVITMVEGVVVQLDTLWEKEEEEKEAAQPGQAAGPGAGGAPPGMRPPGAPGMPPGM